VYVSPGAFGTVRERNPLESRTMSPTIACVAPSRARSRTLAREIAQRLPGERVEAYSLAGYLTSEDPPSRIVLCAAAGAAASDRRFLERAAARLLWPPPPRRLREAIGGLRNEEETPGGSARTRDAAQNDTAALLLEGVVGRDRARAALRAGGPRAWIVETPGCVRLAESELARLSRAGVRWSVLRPSGLEAVYASPALARSAESWRRLLPKGTPVWIRRPPRRRS
jgi:hypothetical protein